MQLDNQFLKQQKEKLEKIKDKLIKELESVAVKDSAGTGSWEIRFPAHNGGTGSSALEDATDEVEELATRLPLERDLEYRLKEVDTALEKIAQKTYGQCEKCKKPISRERLQLYPEARKCIKCERG